MEEKWKNVITVSFISNRQFLLLLLLFLQLLPFESRSVSSSFYDGVVVTHSDLHVLRAFKHDLIDPKGVLRSWNVNGSDPCSGGWEGIKCVRGEVISIQLPWKGLRGLITRRIGELRSLRKLNLHDNLIHGAIPTSLGFLPNLRGIHLFNNRLSGTIPPSIFDCPMLQSLDLSNNNLTGTIPSSSNSSRLYRVNLSFNHLSGSFPAGLTQSRSLTFLFLQNNNLSGTIPDTWGGSENNTYQIKSLILDHNFISGPIPASFQKLSLIEQISLSNNLINGSIPEEIGSLSKLKVLDLSHNFLGGNIPVGICNLTSLIQLKLDYNRLENQIPDAMNDLKSLSVLSLKGNQIGGQIPVNLGKLSNLTFLDLSENQLSGEIPSNMDIIPDLIFLNVSYNNLSGSVPPLLSAKFNSSSFRGNLQLCGYSVSTPCLSSPVTSMPNLPPTTTSHEPNRQRKRIRDIMLITLGSLLILLFILLLCFLLLCCLVRRRRGTSNPKTRTLDGKSGGTKSSSETGNDTGGKLVHFDGTMMFSADDLLCATAEIMGKSTYGTVYKATFEDGNDVAVKRLREKISKNQKEFEAEVNWLGKIRHPNLLALRAYYLGPKGEKLLVYDYVSKGSLAAFLHARKAEIPMNWTTRMNIIVGISRGLRHLHIKENIIHGNLTSKNVLLDENMNAKISHFGILRLMNTTSVNTHTIAAAGTIGYAAPELAKLKKPTLKSDIYSLGVIMLELLTGRSPNEAMNGTDLPQWVASVVKEEWTNEVFDLELMKDQTTATGDELINTLKLALHCVDPSPASRPEIEHVLQQLEEIRPEFASGSDEQASIEIPGDNE